MNHVAATLILLGIGALAAVFSHAIALVIERNQL